MCRECQMVIYLHRNYVASVHLDLYKKVRCVWQHVAGCFVHASWTKSICGETADMAVCDYTSPWLSHWSWKHEHEECWLLIHDQHTENATKSLLLLPGSLSPILHGSQLFPSSSCTLIAVHSSRLCSLPASKLLYSFLNCASIGQLPFRPL